MNILIHSNNNSNKNINNKNKNNYEKLTIEEDIKSIEGTLIYIIVFIIIIPYFLYKLKFYEFLKLYFINTDLLATVISFDRGYFKHRFKYLYNDSRPFVGFLSQTIIKWVVLMGLFYYTISENCNKPKSYTLSKLAFILIITYLIPSRYLIKMQNKLYDYLTKKRIFNEKMRGIVTIFIGIILSMLFIAFESLVIFLYSHKLKKIIDHLFKII